MLFYYFQIIHFDSNPNTTKIQINMLNFAHICCVHLCCKTCHYLLRDDLETIIGSLQNGQHLLQDF